MHLAIRFANFPVDQRLDQRLCFTTCCVGVRGSTVTTDGASAVLRDLLKNSTIPMARVQMSRNPIREAKVWDIHAEPGVPP